MSKILILEDDAVQNYALFETLSNAYPNWDIHRAFSLQDANKLLEQSIQTCEYYSLFLLDIQLNNTTEKFGGFEFAENVRKHSLYFSAPILFLTSLSGHIGYALSNFHCYNYIAKPYSMDDILFQIEQMLLTGFMDANSISVTASNRIRHRIFLDNILYIEAKSHQVLIKTENGDIVSRELIFQSIPQLLTEGFIQCHRKYIINTKHITQYDRTNHYVHVKNIPIPVSKTYQKCIENILS